MSSASNVVPHDFTSSVTVTSFTIQNVAVQLFNGASLDAFMFDVNGNLYKVQRVIIDQEEYLQWNNDDSYIVDLVATKLGLTLESGSAPDIPVPVPGPDIPVPVPVPVPEPV
jgi:hypothetical protein